MPTVDSDPLPRLSIGLADRYVFREEIGRGGAALVYRATDRKLQRDVAVKVLRPDVSAAVGEARFRREIEIAGKLQHPNILPLFDVGTVDGQLYYTMPYVAGESLHARLRRERQMRLSDTIGIARSVAQALDYAHAHGVIHRDVKPANILLDKNATLVADFGIARAMRVVTGDEITDSGIVIGTPEYMSPEQATGDQLLDGRSDVYALGCVVYEMLAGEPPFTGPSAQAVVARHCHDTPRSIRVIRSAIPLGVEKAIERALAKVPADRFETVAEFVDALEAGIDLRARTDIFGITRLTTPTRAIVATAVAAVGVGVVSVLMRPSPVVDANQVVVFPLHDTERTEGHNRGEDVATVIGYALDGTRPLKWRDGWELLDSARRESGTRLGAREASRLSRIAGAGYFVDGSILQRPDSTVVVLRLHSVLGDSIVRTVGRAGPRNVPPDRLGLAAVQDLLPDLVSPGGIVDIRSLRDRKPAAVANFLQGEREYRRMRFANALSHYRAALRADSAFALAALRGSYAASWLSEIEEASDLVAAALRHSDALTPALAFVTRALAHYVGGSGDSAIAHLRRALRADSLVHGGWTLLGETLARLPSTEWAADSLARVALERARAIDPDFAPTLLLLQEFALQDGDVARATQLGDELARAEAETTHVSLRDVMLRCVSRGPDAVDWGSAIARDSMAVLGAAKILSGAARQPECALAAFRSLLVSHSLPLNIRAAALLGMQAQLAAIGKARESWTEFELGGARLPNRTPVLASAAATGSFGREASAISDSAQLIGYSKVSLTTLWLLADLEARRGNVTRLSALAAAARHKADSSRAPADLRLARSIGAWLALVRGDTNSALAVFRNPDRRTTRTEFIWRPWASLTSERMAAARILFARRQFEEARRMASFADQAEPVANPFYIRESLQLRADAADSLGDPALAAQYRQRLRRLDACCKSRF